MEVAQSLGIEDARALRFAWRLAQVHAALRGGATLIEDDLTQAIRAVLVPRATRWPQASEDSPPEQAPPDTAPDQSPEPPSGEGQGEPMPPPEMLLAASLASLPADVLDRMLWQAQASRSASAQGHSGELRRNSQRGRPLPSRPGRPGDQARLDILATLRHAAPRQRLRSRPAHSDASSRVLLRAEDFHTKRYQQHSPTCLILALDASGSAAIHRLAQAKGAVELLLAQSYARRDSVCVIGFRGARAECLLPPTRSLVRAKRALAGLPGGGGTPLASALDATRGLVDSLRRAGDTPVVVVLTDGRANIARDGSPGRQRATEDALSAAGALRALGVNSLLLDTGPQPTATAQALASRLGAAYLPLPHADARAMSGAVRLASGRP